MEPRVDSPPATGSSCGGDASGSRSGASSVEEVPAGSASGSAIDSTGTSIRRSSSLRAPASTIVTWRWGPTRKRPISSSGFWVALRPMRWISAGGCAAAPTGPCERACASRTWASRRSSVSARCEPRFECATAWISSTITASTPSSIERACEVRIRYSDSGVVTRMSGGLRTIAARSRWGVSPVRIPTRTSSAPIPRNGTRRLRSMS